MSKVEMSLQEYNDLMSRLNLAEEIIAAMTTPTEVSWDLEWFNDHPTSAISVQAKLEENLTQKHQKYVRQLIAQNLKEYVISNGLEPEKILYDVDLPTINLTYIQHKPEEETEE